jgi:beta-galactosidase
LFDDGWRFTKNDPAGAASLSYSQTKQWTLPTGNAFISDPASRYERPSGNLGDGTSYIAADFDDSGWQAVTLPHDYAIAGPFTNNVSANMGRLPATGVAWYRKRFDVPADDAGKSIFIDFDGAMAYSLVWVNGQIVGGWPYGYSSFRVDITPYVKPGESNSIAVRVDNLNPTGTNWDQGTSRWYPGAGIYRDVWLVTTDPVHVAQWGTFVRTPEVSDASATIDLDVTVDNASNAAATASITTEFYELDASGYISGDAVANIAQVELQIAAGSSAKAETSGTISTPKRWGPPPTQMPNLYAAVTQVSVGGEVVDVYRTNFGIRTLELSADRGLIVNGEAIKVKGVCNHHDLGALGSATYPRGKERQLEILAEMGANGIRTAHNPEAPVFYELADRLGFLVMDEAFDVWSNGKTALDHHLFFDEWHEQDLRSMIRRDRNHPSVFIWSIGNEIPDQSNSGIGPTANAIRQIANDEDPTRQTTSGMNSANPGSAFADSMQSIGLNYQGSGVRDAAPEYPDFHNAYPTRFLIGTETTDAYSSRGVYTFPVVGPNGEPASAGGGLTNDGQVSSYDLYHADWSYVPDLEFRNQDQWAYVAGEFVWTGFDYLGEPDPHSGTGARSSYSGIIDLAGFPKDRFYLYQANWRRDLAMVHVLPHWNWAGREGQVTPIHVYTSGDSAELYINDQLVSRKTKAQGEYRLRWDDVTYEPGTVRVVAFKDGAEWATATMATTGAPAGIKLEPDRTALQGDGRDLSFVKATIVDSEGRMVPTANNAISFSVAGSGALVATDNGDAMDRTVFSSASREAFSGLALAIVRANPSQSGEITVTATASGLTAGEVSLTAQ